MKPYSYGLSILLLLPGLVHAQPIEEWAGLGYLFGGRAIIEATDAAGNEVPELTGTFVTGLPVWETWPNVDSLGYCFTSGGHGPFLLDYVQDFGPEQTPGGEACDEDLPILNDLSGKAALIRRGACEFTTKALNVQDAGAIASIIYNDDFFDPPEPDVTELLDMLGGEEAEEVTTPSIFISEPLGQDLAELLDAEGSVEVAFFASDSVYSSVTDLGPDGVPCTPELCDGEQATARPTVTGCTIADVDDAQPQRNRLTVAHPNPFAVQTRFGLTLAEAQRVEVAVYDVLGQEVVRLHEGILAPGVEHALTFDGQGLASGVYLVRAVGEAFADARRVVLVR